MSRFAGRYGFPIVSLALFATVIAILATLAPFDREEGIKLSGSILGSALAVGAAILVFEYQSRRSFRKQWIQCKSLIENVGRSSENALQELASGNLEKLPLAVDLMKRDHQQLGRFLDKFEFEDIRFSDVAMWFNILEPDEIKGLMNDVEFASDHQESQRLAHQLEHWIKFSMLAKAKI